jgi:hypothetical protein
MRRMFIAELFCFVCNEIRQLGKMSICIQGTLHERTEYYEGGKVRMFIKGMIIVETFPKPLN